MALFLAPIINGQQFDANGNPLNGGKIYVYLAGSSTPAVNYTTQAASTPNSAPIVLNTLGVNAAGDVWLSQGAEYKFVIKDAANVTLRTIDDVSGINDNTVAVDQWVLYQAAPTYVSATSFTVAGDQTGTFGVGRRVKTINTGGTIYSSISASSYSSPNTTVTVVNDSGVLDSGLSAVSYGLISVVNGSLPRGLLIGIQSFNASGTYTPTTGTTRVVVELCGGGGAGGGGNANAANWGCGGGGGAGGYSMSYLTSGFSGLAVTVGAGGAGVAGAAGGAGGTSSLAALLTATGGAGGAGGGFNAATISIGGAGGAGASGSILNAAGAMGSTGVALSNGQVVSGAGGASMFGAGAAGINNGSTSGNTAASRGAGGGGATTATGNSTNITGGAGLAGYVRVWEYA